MNRRMQNRRVHRLGTWLAVQHPEWGLRPPLPVDFSGSGSRPTTGGACLRAAHPDPVPYHIRTAACPFCWPELFDGSLGTVPVAAFCSVHGPASTLKPLEKNLIL